MEALIGNLLDRIEPGEPRSFNKMGVVPLTWSGDGGPAYLTMSQGFAQGVLRVEEINEGGSVPELSVVNRSELHILLLDGEEVRGAKQNRVLNTSILVAPGCKCTIPVSCTEQGRWRYTSRNFEDSGVLMSQSLRQRKQASVSKNLREMQSFRSDQHEVWDGVEVLHQKIGTSSPTGAMRDAYEIKKDDLEEYAQAFAELKDIHGIAVFLGGKLVGLDFVSYLPAMNDLLPKLVGSYAMDALALEEDDEADPDPVEAKNLLRRIGRCALETQKSQGVGDDARLDGLDLQGAALLAMDTVIHLSTFTKAEERVFKGGMSSFSHRRRFRDSF